MFTCSGKHLCFSSWLVPFKASPVTAPSPRVPSTFDRPETGALVEASRRSESSGSRRRNPFFRVRAGKRCEGEGEAVALRDSHMAAVRADWGRLRGGGAGAPSASPGRRGFGCGGSPSLHRELLGYIVKSHLRLFSPIQFYGLGF